MLKAHKVAGQTLSWHKTKVMSTKTALRHQQSTALVQSKQGSCVHGSGIFVKFSRQGETGYGLLTCKHVLEIARTSGDGRVAAAAFEMFVGKPEAVDLNLKKAYESPHLDFAIVPLEHWPLSLSKKLKVMPIELKEEPAVNSNNGIAVVIGAPRGRHSISIGLFAGISHAHLHYCNDSGDGTSGGSVWRSEDLVGLHGGRCENRGFAIPIEEILQELNKTLRSADYGNFGLPLPDENFKNAAEEIPPPPLAYRRRRFDDATIHLEGLMVDNNNFCTGNYTLEADEEVLRLLQQFHAQRDGQRYTYTQNFSTGQVNIAGLKEFELHKEAQDILDKFMAGSKFFFMIALCDMQINGGIAVSPGTILVMPGFEHDQPLTVADEDKQEFFATQQGGHNALFEAYCSDPKLKRFFLGGSINRDGMQPDAAGLVLGNVFFKSGVLNVKGGNQQCGEKPYRDLGEWAKDTKAGLQQFFCRLPATRKCVRYVEVSIEVESDGQGQTTRPNSFLRDGEKYLVLPDPTHDTAQRFEYLQRQFLVKIPKAALAQAQLAPLTQQRKGGGVLEDGSVERNLKEAVERYKTAGVDLSDAPSLATGSTVRIRVSHDVWQALQEQLQLTMATKDALGQESEGGGLLGDEVSEPHLTEARNEVETYENDGVRISRNVWQAVVVVLCVLLFLRRCVGDKIDYCASAPCDNNGTCADGYFGAYRCLCDAAWTGDNCDVDVDECQDSSLFACKGYSTCKNTVGSYECVCDVGYEMADGVCVNIDDCASTPCLNGGTCADGITAFSCAAWRGDNCDVAVNEGQTTTAPYFILTVVCIMLWSL